MSGGPFDIHRAMLDWWLNRADDVPQDQSFVGKLRQGAEYTWDREDQFRKRLSDLFSENSPSFRCLQPEPLGTSSSYGRIMPPSRFKKKSVRKIVEKRVAKAIEKYEKTRVGSNNAGGSGSTNTG
ncbi:hypothetical protein Tco_1556157 [Tanacetum coccineum]